ncbi:MAG: hypothetical protein AB8B85_16520 [Paracoccaceae bacterium]
MMKTLIPAAFATLFALLAGPAVADFKIGVRLGPTTVVAGSVGVRGQIVSGAQRKRQGEHALRRTERRAKRYPDGYPYRHRPRTLVIYRDRPTVQQQPSDPVPQIADPLQTTLPNPQEAALPEPSNPAGHARIARAPAAARPLLMVGENLPSGIPHVTLDTDRFDLPRAPEGEIYVRFRTQVLRITQMTRRITAVLDQ